MLVLSRLRVSCSWGARRPEYWSVPSCRGTRSRVTPHGCHTRGGQGPAPPPTLRLIRVSPAGPLTPFLIAGASPGSRVAFHSLWPLVFLTFMALRLPKCPGQAPCGASFRWVCATLPGDRIQSRPLWQGVPGARLSSQCVLSGGTWLTCVPFPALLTWVTL